MYIQYVFIYLSINLLCTVCSAKLQTCTPIMYPKNKGSTRKDTQLRTKSCHYLATASASISSTIHLADKGQRSGEVCVTQATPTPNMVQSGSGDTMRFQGSKFKQKNSSSASLKIQVGLAQSMSNDSDSPVPCFPNPFRHEKLSDRFPNPKLPSLTALRKHDIESYPDYPWGLPGAGLAGGSGAITRGRP